MFFFKRIGMAFVMGPAPAMAPSTRVHILGSFPNADVGKPLVVGMPLVVVVGAVGRQRVAPARPGAKDHPGAKDMHHKKRIA